MDQALSAQKLRVQAYSKAPKPAATAAGAKKFNPRTIVLIAALGGLYFYMDQEEPKKAPPKAAVKKPSEEDNRGLATYLPGSVEKDVSKTAEQIS